MDLLIRIASVDGAYNRFEQDFIAQVTRYLGVNMERVRTMINKAVDISQYDSNADIDRQLGLTAGMTVEEKKKRLREEYRKWNQQSANNNEKIRRQASAMLDIIARKRAELE